MCGSIAHEQHDRSTGAIPRALDSVHAIGGSAHPSRRGQGCPPRGVEAAQRMGRGGPRQCSPPLERSAAAWRWTACVRNGSRDGIRRSWSCPCKLQPALGSAAPFVARDRAVSLSPAADSQAPRHRARREEARGTDAGVHDRVSPAPHPPTNEAAPPSASALAPISNRFARMRTSVAGNAVPLDVMAAPMLSRGHERDPSEVQPHVHSRQNGTRDARDRPGTRSVSGRPRTLGRDPGACPGRPRSLPWTTLWPALGDPAACPGRPCSLPWATL